LYPKTKTKPWLHQAEGWNLAKNHPAFYYAVDMGGGKTKMGVDYCTGVNAHLVLVLCPKKVIPLWPRQFDLHCGVDFRFFAPEKKISVAKKAVLLEDEIQMMQAANLRLAVILNYEAFWRPPLGPTYNKKNRMVNRGLLMKYPWDVMICDEAHRLMAPGGTMSWAAMRVGKQAKRRLFLSGTPMPSSPINIYAQFRALNTDIFGTRFTDFRRRYCEMGGYEGRQILEYINQDELHQKFYSIAFRVETDEVLDLPGVRHELLKCKLDPKARRIYDQLEEEFVAQVDSGEITVQNALVKGLRLSEITGGFVKPDDGVRKQIDTNKMDTLIERLQDLGTESVVIFYRFKPEVAEMKKRIAKIKIGDYKGQPIYRTVGEISGDINDELRWIHKEIDTVCVQIQAGGEGLDTLKRARYGFFYSKGMLGYGKWKQAVKRLDRPGQTRKVLFYHLVARNTIDMKIERGIKKGGNVIEYVLEEMRTQKPKPFAKVA